MIRSIFKKISLNIFISKLYLRYLFGRLHYHLICDTVKADHKKPIAVLLFFKAWKKQFIGDFFPEFDLRLLKRQFHLQFIFKWLKKQDCTLIVWGYNDEKYLANLLANSKKLIRVEDGFLRSIKLGKSRSFPLSLAIDYQGLYYNATTVSDLENILNHHQFSAAELQLAKQAITLIKEKGVSKYNHAPQIELEGIIGKKTNHRVLVIGQVAGDASLRYGCREGISNEELLKIAWQENPDSEIIYKIHPDLLSFPDVSNIKHSLVDFCTIIATDIAPASLFKGVDKVYTITSLMGFEALLYHLPVICIGAPFYSNWGLTEDRQIVVRRKRRRTLEEVFCAAYILYPRYPYKNVIETIKALG